MSDDSAGTTSNLISVGDQSYSQEELNKLVGLGRIGLEAEEKFSTSLDKVWPEYTKKSQRVKELEGQLAELEATRQTAPSLTSTDDEETIRQAKDAAKKLGIVTQDDFDALLDQKFRGYYAKERAAEQLL